MRAVPRALLGFAFAAVLGACAEEPPPGGPALRVSWAAATGPQAGLPPEVDALTVRVLDPDGDPATRELELSRDELTDDTPWGVVGGIPVGRPVEVRIEARQGESIAYTGVVGPFVLRPGERRYVDLLLVPTNATTAIARLAEPRAMHTATTLADGRILFAGGFRDATTAPCVNLPDGSRCFALTATSLGELYDPGTGRLYRVRLPMVEARAGHTATVLPDGRVLLVGGVSAAQLAFVAQVDGGFLPVLQVDPLQPDASAEVFDPERDPEDDDVESDGDPARGGFVGTAAMTAGRVEHTATLLPSGEAVLVAGGLGGEVTSEIWRDEGWSDAGLLTAARSDHVAVAVPQPASVWLIGGALGAAGTDDVASVFTVAADGRSGAWGSAGALELPSQGTTPAAGLNLSGAGALLLAGRTAVVFGWMGPVCDAGGEPGWTGTPCPPDDRDFAIDLSTRRVAQPVGRAGERHAMGAAVSTPDGGGLVLGGFSDLVPTATAQVERLTGDVDVATVQPAVDPSTSLSLGIGRALLAGASQTDGAVVVAGGLSLEPGGLQVSDVVEVVNPAR